VCREALRIIGKDFSDPPVRGLHHRWQKGGTCPRTGAKPCSMRLSAGRTTCWSPRSKEVDQINLSVRNVRIFG